MKARITLRVLALAYLGALVLIPLAMILYRTFEDGIGAFIDSVTRLASISAIILSLTIVAIVVPLSAVFGLVPPLPLSRGRFPGRRLLEAVSNLPFAVSRLIVGVALIL